MALVVRGPHTLTVKVAADLLGRETRVTHHALCKHVHNISVALSRRRVIAQRARCLTAGTLTAALTGALLAKVNGKRRRRGTRARH